MKRKLLFAVSLISGLSFGQFTQSNEPVVGNTLNYYLCDSLVNNYSAITGTGVTWDYSTIAGVSNIQKLSSVIDAATSPYIADYTGAVKATQVESAITTFFSSDANARTSQGFVYNEPTLGEVKAKWSIDPQVTYQYPMAYGDEFMDLYSGTLSSDVASSDNCNGKSYSKIDGQGTLLLAGNSYSNILRLCQIDTANATLVFGQITVIRTQYEYYDLANNSLPIFTHSSIAIQTPLGAFAQSIVLSKDQPTVNLSVAENALSNVTVQPNPAEQFITVSGLESTADLTLYDQSGRQLQTISGVENGQSIALDGIENGMYYLIISDNATRAVRQFMKF
ncbi:MAG: T9SS type A sorting domain-containing protein [Bacteroidota bacterium]|jgi:hypothetical protein